MVFLFIWIKILNILLEIKLKIIGVMSIYIWVVVNTQPVIYYILDFGKISFDLELLPVNEYAKKLINQGMILEIQPLFIEDQEPKHMYLKIY